MARSLACAALLGLLLAAGPAGAQAPPAAPPQSAPPAVQIETTPAPPKLEGARVVPPPLHYETTRPPDTGRYERDVRVEHDPAFIEPFTGYTESATSSARYGLSGWTSPNTPVGPALHHQEINGWLGFGFSIVWGGPPAARPAALRPVAPAR